MVFQFFDMFNLYSYTVLQERSLRGIYVISWDHCLKSVKVVEATVK